MWYNLAKAIKNLRCKFSGHTWEPWEHMKYIPEGRERTCQICGEHQIIRFKESK